MCLRWDQLQMIIWNALRVPTSYEAVLIPKMSRKMNYCPCERPQSVFVPEESHGGSGYSLSLCWDHKWTNLHSDIWKQQLWRRVITQHLLSHVFSFMCSIKSILVVFMNGLHLFTSSSLNDWNTRRTHRVCRPLQRTDPLQQIPQCVLIKMGMHKNKCGFNILY